MGNDKHQARREYPGTALAAADLRPDPLQQFHQWLADAEAAAVVDATAMTVATVDSQGHPSARIVLLKAYGAEGFTFYTDTGSDKGQHLRANPYASLLFYWRELARQVRINGPVVAVADDQAQAYFATRPRDSQLSAAASFQSQPVVARAVLEDKVKQLAQQHGEAGIPKPGRWGGYTLQAESYEFWQGRPGRLHDRFSYHRDKGEKGTWRITRLQP